MTKRWRTLLMTMLALATVLVSGCYTVVSKSSVERRYPYSGIETTQTHRAEPAKQTAVQDVDEVSVGNIEYVEEDVYEDGEYVETRSFYRDRTTGLTIESVSAQYEDEVVEDEPATIVNNYYGWYEPTWRTRGYVYDPWYNVGYGWYRNDPWDWSGLYIGIGWYDPWYYDPWYWDGPYYYSAWRRPWGWGYYDYYDRYAWGYFDGYYDGHHGGGGGGGVVVHKPERQRRDDTLAGFLTGVSRAPRVTGGTPATTASATLSTDRPTAVERATGVSRAARSNGTGKSATDYSPGTTVQSYTERARATGNATVTAPDQTERRSGVNRTVITRRTPVTAKPTETGDRASSIQTNGTTTRQTTPRETTGASSQSPTVRRRSDDSSTSQPVTRSIPVPRSEPVTRSAPRETGGSSAPATTSSSGSSRTSGSSGESSGSSSSGGNSRAGSSGGSSSGSSGGSSDSGGSGGSSGSGGRRR